MKSFYLVPTALLASTRPQAPHHAVTTLDDLDTSIVVVLGWDDPQAQDTWEDHPDVETMPLWSWSSPAPAKLQGGFKSHGVKATHSTGEAMREVRRHFPHVRP